MIEHEFILLAIDLALHRLPAHRHLLFNRLPHCLYDTRQLLRMAAVLVILDIHVKYAQYVNSTTSPTTPDTHHEEGDPTDTTRYQLQLLSRIFFLSVLEHVVFIAVLMGLSLWRLAVARRRIRRISERQEREGKEMVQQQQVKQQAKPPKASPLPTPPASSSWSLSLVGHKVMQGLLYSEFGRLLVVFVHIWDNQISVSNLIGLLVLTSQWQALRAVMGVASVAAGEEDKEEGNGEKEEEEGWRIEAEMVAFPFLVALACKGLLRLAVHHLDAAAVNLWLV